MPANNCGTHYPPNVDNESHVEGLVKGMVCAGAGDYKEYSCGLGERFKEPAPSVLVWRHCTLGGTINRGRQLGITVHVFTKVGQTLSALRAL